jgi:hypothetical protein
MPKKNSKTTSKISSADHTKDAMKFQDLEIGLDYLVHEFSRPIKSKYGISYKLTVTKTGSTDKFDVWSGSRLSKYIEEEKPKKKISFTVMYDEKSEMKYPIIKGYNPYSSTQLESDSDSE